jgi:hypothetical protein
MYLGALYTFDDDEPINIKKKKRIPSLTLAFPILIPRTLKTLKLYLLCQKLLTKFQLHAQIKEPVKYRLQIKIHHDVRYKLDINY